MNNSTANLTKKDIPVIAGTVLVAAILAGFFTGFLLMGFQYPYKYSDGIDDYSILSQAKQLAQEKWLWSTDRLGAPYGQQMLDYPSVLLQNTEFIMIKFWSLWTKDPAVIVNIQFFSTFILCAATAYLVLRKLSIGCFFAACGSLLFAFAPYIFWRNFSHYCLAACYFVPFSIYLCFLAYRREDFLKPGSIFRNQWENLLILSLCLLIANNGIGYYPFFTCFLLCVTGGCRYFESRDIRKMLPALKLVFVITFLMLLALLPAFQFAAVNGKNSIASRNLGAIEEYGLKITQFFMPTTHHNIGFLKGITDKYNNTMPLVNENKSSYLGPIAGMGLILQMCSLFGLKVGGRQEKSIQLGAKLSLASILFMSVGGFISFIATVLNVRALRGFNRISIYVMFISIAVMCFWGESTLGKLKKNFQRKCFYVLIIILTAFGVWAQSPDISERVTVLESNGIKWAKDEYFINKIEDALQPNDMVFQLPYIPYPEGMPRQKLLSYRLLNGYLHSDTLRWSFGGIKKRPGDQWYKETAEAEGDQMVKILIEEGFRGLYIDRTGYKEDEFMNLQKQFRRIPGMKPLVDVDGNLVFYSLYPVIEQNSDFKRGN